jgi:hypothetical protein
MASAHIHTQTTSRAVFPNLFLGAEPFWQTKTSAEPILTLNKGTPFDQNVCIGTKKGYFEQLN